MDAVLPIILGIAMVATLIVLFIGLIGFAGNSKMNAKHGNKLMRARVVLQGVALALFAIIMLLSATGG